MSLIKSGDPRRAERVRAVSVAMRPTATGARETAQDQALAAARAEIATLQAELAERDARVARLREGVVQAHKDGVAEGRRAGLVEAEDGRAQCLAALSGGVDAALERFSGQLVAMDHLAVALACEAVGKILSDSEDYRERLARTIRRHVDAVGAGVVIGVSVSHDDFPEPADLADLEAKVARRGLMLTPSRDLRAGGCEVRLRLGVLEIGLDQQWDRLQTLFGDLIGDEASR